MFVCFFNRLLNENNVVLRSGIINVLGVEFAVVVSKAAFALTMGNAFFAHMYNLRSLHPKSGIAEKGVEKFGKMRYNNLIDKSEFCEATENSHLSHTLAVEKAGVYGIINL